MKKTLITALGGIVAALALSTPAAASEVCGPLDSGKIDTSGDPQTVTVTAPEGFLVSGYCVKAGSSKQGDGPVYVTVDPPVASITFGYPSGKAVSHYSASWVEVEVPPTTEPPTTTVPPTTEPPTTEPPTTRPPTTRPPVTTPPPTVPPVTEPPVTEPPVTDPPATDPPVTDPPVTDPPAVETAPPPVPPTPPTPEAPQTPPRLPETGGELTLALLGLAALATGYGLVRVARRGA